MASEVPSKGSTAMSQDSSCLEMFEIQVFSWLVFNGWSYEGSLRQTRGFCSRVVGGKDGQSCFQCMSSAGSLSWFCAAHTMRDTSSDVMGCIHLSVSLYLYLSVYLALSLLLSFFLSFLASFLPSFLPSCARTPQGAARKGVLNRVCCM